ncbi:MAG TPA: fibronectin type III domain-containing protein, partial [Candidatus Limnocylindrales bacterium]|nr:fibronectin type III domain-containing protein [Candidatus Limnocylindrales bacterium]
RIATLANTETTYTDPGRTPGATYLYTVRAVDWVDLLGTTANTSLTMFVPTLGTTTASFGDGLATLAADATAVTWTHATTINLGLHFSAPVTLLTPAALTLSGTATGCTVSAITGSGADYIVSVAGCSEGTLVVSIAAGTVHDSLGYLAPAVDASSVTFAIDRTAPVAKKPAAQLREDSSLAGSSLRVRIPLAGSDAGLAPDGSDWSSGVVSYDVGRSVDGAAYATLASATTAAYLDSGLTPGHSYRFRVRARDAAGNVSAWVESVLYKPALTQESSSAITWRGTWYTSSNASYSGGAARYTLTSTPAASYTFSGRGIALVTTKGPARGRMKIYIDGVYVRTIDLYRSSAAYRVLAFSQMFASSGTHTIKVVSVGVSGRPRVDVDAFAVLR